jgi:hypothetical protein
LGAFNSAFGDFPLWYVCSVFENAGRYAEGDQYDTAGPTGLCALFVGRCLFDHCDSDGGNQKTFGYVYPADNFNAREYLVFTTGSKRG